MKEIIAATLIFMAGAWAQSMNTTSVGPAGSVLASNGSWIQQDQMTVPKVTRTQVKHVIEDEVVTRECPAGYEGHYVDQYAGFESHSDWGEQGGIIINGQYVGNGPAYSLCFKKDFMDIVRKNPDLSTYRPALPRAARDYFYDTPSPHGIFTPWEYPKGCLMMPTTTCGGITLENKPAIYSITPDPGMTIH